MDMSQAVHVETWVEIDWSELGRVFGASLSTDQASFLVGMAESLSEAQIPYISSEPILDQSGERMRVFARLFDMAQCIRPK